MTSRDMCFPHNHVLLKCACYSYVYAYTFLKCVHVVFPLLLNMTSRDIMPHVGGK